MKVTIKLTGLAGSGKTAILRLITKALIDNGYDVADNRDEHSVVTEKQKSTVGSGMRVFSGSRGGGKTDRLGQLESYARITRDGAPDPMEGDTSDTELDPPDE